MKEILTVELTEDNLDIIFQALIKKYLKSGMKDTPDIINSFIISLSSLVVSKYAFMETIEDKEKAKEFAKELYLTLHHMLLDYVDYMREKENDYE